MGCSLSGSLGPFRKCAGRAGRRERRETAFEERASNVGEPISFLRGMIDGPMPTTSSAAKRLRQSAKKRLHNRIAKKIVKTSARKALESAASKDFREGRDRVPRRRRQDRQGRRPTGLAPEHRRPPQEQARPRLQGRRREGSVGRLSRVVPSDRCAIPAVAGFDSRVGQLAKAKLSAMPTLTEAYPTIARALAAHNGPRPASNSRLDPFQTLVGFAVSRSGETKSAARLQSALEDADLLDPTELAAADPAEVVDLLREARLDPPVKTIRLLQRLASWYESHRDEIEAARRRAPRVPWTPGATNSPRSTGSAARRPTRSRFTSSARRRTPWIARLIGSCTGTVGSTRPPTTTRSVSS